MSYNILDTYMNEHFPGLPLESPLFYRAQIGIRFELGVQYGSEEQSAYLTNVQLRSILLFNEIFDEHSNILVVVNSYRSVEIYRDFVHGEDVFLRFVKNKNLLSNISSIEIERQYDGTDDLSGVSYQHVLKCNKEDIDFKGIIVAKSHMDFTIEPYISDGIFFINTDKHIIFYMYDERGVDIVSETKSNLLDIYRKYNDWILDYDREKIDSVFKS